MSEQRRPSVVTEYADIMALPPHTPYLTKEEAARLARCNPKTIERAVHSGQLQAFRPARRVLLREEDVRAWIERRGAALPPREPRARMRRVTSGSVASLRSLDPDLRRG